MISRTLLHKRHQTKKCAFIFIKYYIQKMQHCDRPILCKNVHLPDLHVALRHGFKTNRALCFALCFISLSSMPLVLFLHISLVAVIKTTKCAILAI